MLLIKQKNDANEYEKSFKIRNKKEGEVDNDKIDKTINDLCQKEKKKLINLMKMN